MKTTSTSKIASRAITYLIVAVIAMLAFGSAVATATTSTTPSTTTVVAGQPKIVSATASSKVTSVASVKIRGFTHVVTQIKIPKSKVNLRKCFWRSGTWTNSGYKNGVFKTYREKSKAYFCRLKRPIRKAGVVFWYVKMGGGLTHTKCGNLAVPPGLPQPKPMLRGRVLDVTTMTFNVRVRVSAVAKAEATATCVASGASATAKASAYGAASATFTVKVKARTSIQARLRASVRISQKLSVIIKANGKAIANTTASATATCSGGTVYVCPIGSAIGEDAKCHKDGTATPPPPSEAPGPNPAPDPNDPTVTPDNPSGSWACYSETTGMPVAPVNGLCPPGSFGQVAN